VANLHHHLVRAPNRRSPRRTLDETLCRAETAEAEGVASVRESGGKKTKSQKKKKKKSHIIPVCRTDQIEQDEKASAFTESCTDDDECGWH
jgi:hypothetical protein